MKEFVAQFGIEAIEVKTVGLNIRLLGRKAKHLTKQDIDQLIISSHANKFGPGPAQVDFAFARAKIQQFQEQNNG